MDVPEWVKREILKWSNSLDVTGPFWRITVKITDRPGGNSENDGWVSVDGVYGNVAMELNESLEDNEYGRSCVLHEVLHIAHDCVDVIMRRYLDLIPEEQRIVIEEMYRAEVEKFVQRTSRSLCAAEAQNENLFEVHNQSSQA